MLVSGALRVQMQAMKRRGRRIIISILDERIAVNGLKGHARCTDDSRNLALMSLTKRHIQTSVAAVQKALAGIDSRLLSNLLAADCVVDPSFQAEVLPVTGGW
jgi:hypothetical protein